MANLGHYEGPIPHRFSRHKFTRGKKEKKIIMTHRWQFNQFHHFAKIVFDSIFLHQSIVPINLDFVWLPPHLA